MARRKSTSLGVDWHLPDGKGTYKGRRFATSTEADRLGIALLAEQGHTPISARAALPYASTEQKQVLDGYIEAGFGRDRLSDLGVRGA